MLRPSAPRRLALAAGFLAIVFAHAPASRAASVGTERLRAVAAPFLALERYQADFTQTQYWVGVDDPTVSKGTLSLERGGRFRIEYRVPKGHLQVSDGKQVWTYLPENGEVLLAALPDAAGVDLLRRILEGSQADSLVEAAKLDGRGAEVLSLTPPEELGLSRVRLWTEPAGSAILQYEVVDASGNRSIYRLDKTKQNPSFPASHFSFVPPPGVPVVEVGAP